MRVLLMHGSAVLIHVLIHDRSSNSTNKNCSIILSIDIEKATKRIGQKDEVAIGAETEISDSLS